MRTIVPGLILILISACGVSTPTPASAPAGITPLPNPLPLPTSTPLPPHTTWVIAHRGGWTPAENTMLAFHNGLSHGADMIEMDVHLSKDGVVMVIHDETLDRTTSGTGRVADYTYAELAKFDAWRRVGPGTYPAVFIFIPTFAQVMDLLKDNQVRAEVEIKVPPWGRYVGIEEKVIKEIVDRNLTERVQVSSFDFDALRDVKRINPKIKTVALLSTDFFRRALPDQPIKVIEVVQAARADLIAVNKDLLTVAIAQEAHQRGLKVEVWTVDSEAEMRKFMQMGVDGIITNQPDVLNKIARK